MKKSEMKLFFEGANGTVTPSCTRLVYFDGKKRIQILVDCGLNQDAEGGTCNAPEWSFNPADIHCVLLTHAHIDHCGGLPLLYKNGFIGRVYTTEASAKLSKIMLKDSAKATKLYTDEDVEKIKWKCIDSINENRKLGTFFAIAKIDQSENSKIAIRAAFLRSSHILGASSIYIQYFSKLYETEEEKIELKDNPQTLRTILFSGDIGRIFDRENSRTSFLKPNMYPFKNTNDILILESTYGNRLHKPETDHIHKLDKLEQILKDSLVEKKNGYIVIPAFALDRTQTILTDLYDVLMKRNIFPKTNSKKDSCTIHSISPLANEVSKTYASLLSEKMMNDKGKIKYRYLNANPEIPVEFQNEINKNDGTEKDSAIRSRLDALKMEVSHFRGENKFCVKNENHYDKLDSLLRTGQITIGASGMCDKGNIKLVVEKALKDENATIILTGFTPKGSPGEVIKKFVNNPPEEFTCQDLFNKNVPGMNVRLHEIKAKIVDMSDFYSAHADADELCKYVFYNPDPNNQRDTPLQIILNHGTVEGEMELAKKLDAVNAKLGNAPKTIVTSKFCKSFDISSGTGICIDYEDDTDLRTTA